MEKNREALVEGGLCGRGRGRGECTCPESGPPLALLNARLPDRATFLPSFLPIGLRPLMAFAGS